MNYQTETIYAGFWRRVAAFCIDNALLLLLLVPVRFLLAFFGAVGLMNRPVFFEFTAAQLWVFLLQLLTFAAFTGAFGATPGKMMLHMKVVSTRTGGLLWRDAIYRETIGRVMNLLLLIGYIIVPFDPQKRTLADRFCDTRVLATRKYKPAIGKPPQNVSYSAPAPQPWQTTASALPFAPQYPAPDADIGGEANEGLPGSGDAPGFSAAPPAAAITAVMAAPAPQETGDWGTGLGAAPDLSLTPPPVTPPQGDDPTAEGPISH